MVAWLQGLPQPVYACYEAGPTGFGLYRAALEAGVRMEVIAPSKTPRAPGDRIKSDRKDAELLARLLLAGQLKAVAVPSREFEAARHLCRAREQVRGDLMRCRHRRLEAAAPARPRLPGDERPGRSAHRQWLARQRFDEPATELAYLDTLAAVDGLVARKAALDERLSRLAHEGEWWPTVARLRCFRGIDTLTAFVLCTRDRRLRPLPAARAARPPGSGSCPASTSPARAAAKARSPRPAPATPAGSWSRPPGTTCASHGSARPLANRQQGQPAHVLQIAWRAQHRLYRLHSRLRARGKPGNVTTVAVARELACFLWAAATAD